MAMPYIVAQKGNTMHTAYVTSKGQLAIPVKLRRKFNIKQGTRINFAEVADGILMRPVTREYIASFCGIFKQKPGEKSVVEEHLEERRAERDRENRE
jgi:AbrB family looped-hinge helix DNA binding protein